MKRRAFLSAAAAALAAPNLARGASKNVIRFVPYVDLSLLDPVANTATPTRNHAYLVFDTLYGLDTDFNAHPQMAAGHTVDEDWRLWRITLRDGLRFHDGAPVLARDAVASIRRWGVRDNFGQALMAATDELSAPDDRTLQFRMKRPFPLLPDALAKVSPYPCPIMPERLARTDPYKAIEEMVGSGPFRFVAAERLPGARAVYARFEGYMPRPDGTPSISAGPKIAHVDRVEWITMPDAATAAAALQTGEVDWLEAPSPDLLGQLRGNPSIRVEVKDRTGLTPVLRFNCIQPPFDNPAIRRAVLRAANQTEFMQAYSTDSAMWHVKLGVFCPDTPMANDAGMAALFGPTDVARARRELAEAGYKGERVVLMSPSDHPISGPVATVADDLFRRIGLNVDTQAMDSGTLFQRRNSREPVEKGGWSCFPSMVSGVNILNPAVTDTVRGNGLGGWYGWPTSPLLEDLHDKWLQAPDLAAQKSLASTIQAQCWQEATFIPAGQIYQPVAFRSRLSGILPGFVKFYGVTVTG
jgi:peptide/nickel transport system substrate-binding protein